MKLLEIKAKSSKFEEARYNISGDNFTNLRDFGRIAKIEKKETPTPTLLINRCGNLTSLEGIPQDFPWKNIVITGCPKLKNLVGLPAKVERELYIGWNGITDLTGISEVVGTLTFVGEKELTQFNAFPKVIHNNFYASSMTGLRSLTGIGKIDQLDGGITLQMPTKQLLTNLLGVVKIKGLKKFELNYQDAKLKEKVKKLRAILNKYIPTGDLLDCQEELVEAGFFEQAKL